MSRKGTPTPQSKKQAADPREAAPKPPFPAQEQEAPGQESKMAPPPDYGATSYQGHDRLTKRVALITGGDSGIGRAVALAYAREGADVAFTHLPEESDDAKVASGLITDAGRRPLALDADLRDRETCDATVRRVTEEFGRLDVLVNNAGFQWARDQNIDDIDDERLDRVFKTNLYALFWLTRAAVPALRES